MSVHHQESSTVQTAIGICHTGYADWLLPIDLIVFLHAPSDKEVISAQAYLVAYPT